MGYLLFKYFTKCKVDEKPNLPNVKFMKCKVDKWQVDEMLS